MLSKPKSPKTSVVIPCYNSEETVREAVDSVLNQSDGDFELILVDDGSADGTADVIESFFLVTKVLLRNA